MATTQNTFTGDGSTTNYSFTFEYIKQADVKASLDGTVTTAFTLANATTLSFNTAPANGVAIRIFRDTAIDNLKATFSPGSAIKAEDLNDNFTQNNFAVQEADFDVATANTTANTAKTNSETAITTANTADTNASAAVATANTADTNASAAVTTANTASTNASNAVTTANAASATATTADTNATTALNNSRESDGQGGFISAITKANNAVTTANTASTDATSAVNTANAATTTANTAATDAASAVTTANSAATDAATAISTANTASTDAASAVTTANSAASDATSAVSTANTASTNASNAVTTANTASTNATAALNNSRESDGQGGFNTAIDLANAAITASNTATAAVSNAVLFDLITNVSSIPGSPSNNDYIEIGDSTGIQNFSPLSGLPSGFVGASGLTVRLRYDSSVTSWVFMNYFANDSETRYVAIGNPNPTYYANQAAFPSATTYHGGVAHSHADGAMYYAHGGNWIKMAKDSDVTTNATDIATKLPLAGGTLTGDLTLNGAPTTANMAATKDYVDTEVSGLVDAAPGTLDTLNELAAALGDDANFSTTVTNSIATKMPLAGGTFTGDVTFNANIDLQDNDKLLLGTGDDLQIYHDGSDSYIRDAGTGNLQIESNGNLVSIFNYSASENMAKFINNGAVELYYDGSKKLETKTDGIDVTGEVQCDSLDVDGSADISGTLNVGSEVNLLGTSDGNKYIDARLGSSKLSIRGTSGGDANHETLAEFTRNGPVNLFYDNSKKFETTGYGAITSGDHYISSGSNQILLGAGDGAIELTRSTGGAYIDFKNSTSEDYDARIQENNGDITVSAGFTAVGTISDSIGPLRRVGIDNVSGGSGIIGTSAAGKLLRVSSSNITLTIPSNTYTAGDMITFFNVSSTNLTIAQGSSTTIYNSADGATGNRTLAAKGLATLVCTASNEFVISGSQLS